MTVIFHKIEELMAYTKFLPFQNFMALPLSSTKLFQHVPKQENVGFTIYNAYQQKIRNGKTFFFQKSTTTTKLGKIFGFFVQFFPYYLTSVQWPKNVTKILIYTFAREVTGSKSVLEAPVYFQDRPYYHPYRRYHSEICRCTHIVAYFGKKLKICGFLPKRGGNNACILGKECP